MMEKKNTHTYFASLLKVKAFEGIYDIARIRTELARHSSVIRLLPLASKSRLSWVLQDKELPSVQSTQLQDFLFTSMDRPINVLKMF